MAQQTSADQSADTLPSAPPAPARPESLNVKADSSTPSPSAPPPPPPPPPIAIVSDPIVQTNQLSRDSSVVDDDSPREIFKKVVVNDARQNKRLSAKFNGGSSSSNSNGSAFNLLSNLAEDNPKGSTRMRFIVCTLGLMSLAMSQMSRIVINQSITQMVEPHKEAAKKDDAIVGNEFRADDGSCPWPEQLVVESASTTTMAPPTNESPATSSPAQPVNPMLPVLPTSQPTTTTTTLSSEGKLEEEEPDFMSELDKKVETSNETIEEIRAKQEDTSNQYERFRWSVKDQNLVLGGFYWSYFVFMILGGRLAEVYGSKYIILLSVAGSALINLATPWMARSSLTMLVMSRVLLGAIQSGVFPAVYALIAKWLTMSEASIFAPLIKMNLRLGMVFGSLIPGLVPGWPNVFYFTGVISVLWSIAWLFIATSDPADNSWVSAGELKHINRKKRRAIEAQAQVEGIELESGNGQCDAANAANANKAKPSKRSLKTPWLKLITSPSVVGLILVKLTLNYALDFLAIELPSYLRYVHHATRQQISAITTPMFAIQVFLIVFVGWLAKVVIQRRPMGVSKTTVRKLFQGLTSFGMAACFFLLTFNNCNLIFVTILLQLVSFLSMFTAGGETMLPYDLSEDYPATIMSIANSIANVSGITTTTLASIVLADQGGSYQRWNILIYLIAGANLLGGLAFTCLVKAEPIDFEQSTKKEEKKKQHVLTINSTSAPANKENNERARK